MIDLDMQLVEKVERAGLSSKEASIYVALLMTGGAYPSKIAEITKLNRTTIYKILDTLAIRGLVTELEKRNKLFYQVESPKNLGRFAGSQITVAKRHLESAEVVMPVLEGLFSHAENKPIVRFYDGQEGVLRVYEDHVSVNEGYEMLAFSNTSDLMKFLPDDFRLRYIKKKEKLAITTRAILPDQEIDVKYNEKIYAKFPKTIWPNLKHIPRKMFPYKSDLTIYGKNKVSIINFNEPQFAGTIIEDQTVHDMMAMIFELSWNGVK
jgi:sugar-specific transcriptional regulator TrmB